MIVYWSNMYVIVHKSGDVNYLFIIYKFNFLYCYLLFLFLVCSCNLLLVNNYIITNYWTVETGRR